MHGDHVHGEIRMVDHFGNLALNMRRSDLEAAGIQLGDLVELRCGGRTSEVPFTLSFGEVPGGRTVVCEDSFRAITIAVNGGRADRETAGRLRRGGGARPGAPAPRAGRDQGLGRRRSAQLAGAGRPRSAGSPAVRFPLADVEGSRLCHRPWSSSPGSAATSAAGSPALLADDPSIERIIGVDTVPPPRELALGRTEFVRADIRNPLIAKVIATAEVDTVVHLNITALPRAAGGRASMKEMNVIGTMQLLAACQKSASVRQLVVKSSTAVYGSSSRDPALFTEEIEPKSLPRSGYAKDAVEVEGYVRGFARRRPDVSVGVLRFTEVIGPGSDSLLLRYLRLPVVPTVLGFDPRVQLLHADDALEVLRLGDSPTGPAR